MESTHGLPGEVVVVLLVLPLQDVPEHGGLPVHHGLHLRPEEVPQEEDEGGTGQGQPVLVPPRDAHQVPGMAMAPPHLSRKFPAELITNTRVFLPAPGHQPCHRWKLQGWIPNLWRVGVVGVASVGCLLAHVGLIFGESGQNCRLPR